MKSLGEEQDLSYAEFWDERYANADDDKPTHEWLRGFDALESFFDKHLFKARGDEGRTGKVMHLGSGDSVCCQEKSLTEFSLWF
jgi:hypothetical protein